MRRAGLVGTALSPAKRYTKPDGTEMHTLWGELAHHEAPQRKEAEEAAQRATIAYPDVAPTPEPCADERIGASGYTTAPSPISPGTPRPRRMRRYHGAAKLSTLKIATEAGKIAEEILTHLAGLPGAKVRVTLEIEAELPEGASGHVVRTVTENSRVLKPESCGFEEE